MTAHPRPRLFDALSLTAKARLLLLLVGVGLLWPVWLAWLIRG